MRPLIISFYTVGTPYAKEVERRWRSAKLIRVCSDKLSHWLRRLGRNKAGLGQRRKSDIGKAKILRRLRRESNCPNRRMSAGFRFWKRNRVDRENLQELHANRGHQLSLGGATLCGAVTFSDARKRSRLDRVSPHLGLRRLPPNCRRALGPGTHFLSWWGCAAAQP